MFDLTDNFAIDPTAYVAESVKMYGRVSIRSYANIWDGVILRGDFNEIVIGSRTSIQEYSVIHVGIDHPTHIGDDVVIGHCAVVDSATVESNCLIGINATVLPGAVVKSGSVIGAGAVVSPNTVIPAGSVAFGVPAEVVKPTTDKLMKYMKRAVGAYVELSQAYKAKQEAGT